MPASPKTLRTRNMTAAKRSLKLILEEAQAQLATLENGGVPDSGFMPSVIKYEQALTALRTLDALDRDAPDDAIEVLVQPGDLDVLLRLVRVQFGPDALAGDSPLGHLAAAAWPDGVPAAVAAPAPDQEG